MGSIQLVSIFHQEACQLMTLVYMSHGGDSPGNPDWSGDGCWWNSEILGCDMLWWFILGFSGYEQRNQKHPFFRQVYVTDTDKETVAQQSLTHHQVCYSEDNPFSYSFTNVFWGLMGLGMNCSSSTLWLADFLTHSFRKRTPLLADMFGDGQEARCLWNPQAPFSAL